MLSLSYFYLRLRPAVSCIVIVEVVATWTDGTRGRPWAATTCRWNGPGGYGWHRQGSREIAAGFPLMCSLGYLARSHAARLVAMQVVGVR